MSGVHEYFYLYPMYLVLGNINFSRNKKNSVLFRNTSNELLKSAEKQTSFNGVFILSLRRQLI